MNELAIRLRTVQQELHRIMHRDYATSWLACDHPDCRFTREILASAVTTPTIIERINDWVTIERRSDALVTE